MTATLAASAALSNSGSGSGPGSGPAPTAERPGRRRPKLVDWRRAARLLAEGKPPAEIAPAVGIDEAHFWRHLRNSLRFQFYVRQARERRRLLAQLQFGNAACDAALRSLHNAERLDAESLRWVAATAGLVAAGDGMAAETGDDLIHRLGETGRLPKKPCSAPAAQPAVVEEAGAAEPTVETKRNEAPRRAATPAPTLRPAASHAAPPASAWGPPSPAAGLRPFG